MIKKLNFRLFIYRIACDELVIGVNNVYNWVCLRPPPTSLWRIKQSVNPHFPKPVNQDIFKNPHKNLYRYLEHIHYTGWSKKSLWFDLEEKCLRSSNIFFDGVFLSIYSHLLKTLELSELCRKSYGALKIPKITSSVFFPFLNLLQGRL